MKTQPNTNSLSAEDERLYAEAEYAAEMAAENAWLIEAEAGTPESWAEEDQAREMEALYG